MIATRKLWRWPKRRYLFIALAAAALFAAAGCGTETREPTEAPAEKAATDAQRQSMRVMDETAERAYRSAQAGDLEEARSSIAQLAVLTTKLNYDAIATVEGMEAVAGAVTSAMRALNAVSPDAPTVLQKVAGARLAVDALSHRQQPMWLTFRSPLAEDLKRLSDAAATKDDPAASLALAAWRGHAELVRAAIVVSRGVQEATKLDSMTIFLTNGLREADWESIRQAMPQLRTSLDELFEEEHRETVSPLIPTAEPPHPALWSFGLGSFIVTVLGYVAWRKYRAEQGVVRVKSNRDFSGRA